MRLRKEAGMPKTPEQILALRRSYGEPRDKFARRVGCGTASLWKWEHGICRPDARFMAQLWALEKSLAKKASSR